MELNISLEYRAFHFSISFGKTLKPKLPQKTQAVSLNAAGKAYLDVIEREYGGTNDLSNLVPGRFQSLCRAQRWAWRQPVQARLLAQRAGHR